MTQMKELQDKARELGFKIKKGPTKFSGYILQRLNVIKRAPETSKRKATAIDEIIDENEELQIEEYESQIDEYPLGTDYKWSLAHIEDYLENLASDIAAGRVKASDDDDAEPEVETSTKVAKVKPPSRKTLSVALRGHSDKKEIQSLMKSAKVSEGKTLQDLQFEERAYQARKRHAIEEAWKTNLDSRFDPMGEDDRYFLADMFIDPDKAHQQEIERIRREDAAFLSPETGGYDTPKPASGFQVVSKRRQKSI